MNGVVEANGVAEESGIADLDGATENVGVAGVGGGVIDDSGDGVTIATWVGSADSNK